MHGSKFWIIIATIVMLLRPGIGSALPPYQRLFEVKYEYRPNCTMCHDLDNWEMSPYGKLFFKSSRSFNAFEEIEGDDPDQDGIPSGEEIRASANPGDPRSTPKKPGNWLQKIPKPFAPP